MFRNVHCEISTVILFVYIVNGKVRFYAVIRLEFGDKTNKCKESTTVWARRTKVGNSYEK